MACLLYTDDVNLTNVATPPPPPHVCQLLLFFFFFLFICVIVNGIFSSLAPSPRGLSFVPLLYLSPLLYFFCPKMRSTVSEWVSPMSEATISEKGIEIKTHMELLIAILHTVHKRLNSVIVLQYIY